jgi:D-serine deaminase-like pyridoxal phosphate-dependent protein
MNAAVTAGSAATPVPADVDTPEILVDVDILDRNIERMAQAVKAKGLALRPHAKTHKIPEIAARQLAAGAAGLTVATIGEAEVFAASGVQDLFIAYPLWISP